MISAQTFIEWMNFLFARIWSFSSSPIPFNIDTRALFPAMKRDLLLDTLCIHRRWLHRRKYLKWRDVCGDDVNDDNFCNITLNKLLKLFPSKASNFINFLTQSLRVQTNHVRKLNFHLFLWLKIYSIFPHKSNGYHIGSTNWKTSPNKL